MESRSHDNIKIDFSSAERELEEDYLSDEIIQNEESIKNYVD